MAGKGSGQGLGRNRQGGGQVRRQGAGLALQAVLRAVLRAALKAEGRGRGGGRLARRGEGDGGRRWLPCAAMHHSPGGMACVTGRMAAHMGQLASRAATGLPRVCMPARVHACKQHSTCTWTCGHATVTQQGVLQPPSCINRLHASSWRPLLDRAPHTGLHLCKSALHAGLAQCPVLECVCARHCHQRIEPPTPSTTPCLGPHTTPLSMECKTPRTTRASPTHIGGRARIAICRAVHMRDHDVLHVLQLLAQLLPAGREALAVAAPAVHVRTHGRR